MNDSVWAVDLTVLDPAILGRGPRLAVEASKLQMPVGLWPNTLRLRGRTRTIDFQKVTMNYASDDLTDVDYAGGGFTLTVFND